MEKAAGLDVRDQKLLSSLRIPWVKKVGRL